MEKIFLIILLITIVSCSAFAKDIVLVVPDDQIIRVLDAVAGNYKYQDQILDPDWINPGDGSQPPMINNPVSKAKFARQQLYRWIRRQILKWERTKGDLETRATLEATAIEIQSIAEPATPDNVSVIRHLYGMEHLISDVGN